ncbi:39S ribosomal protein L22, mitochondrial [Cladophialophora chaetospira]|uniref:39S ribosomal protein L22, mitochondrial n=1 Tax=Cladophialophora chaetospira TaxID=386627 RepID=A0AA38WZG6_9EURO|nr:39S ribosomal protein L22, mitochondrial [Cladophialophora chaetospira]
MNSQQTALRRICRGKLCQSQTPSSPSIDISRLMTSLHLRSTRSFHSSHSRNASATAKSPSRKSALPEVRPKQLTPQERMRAAQRRAQEKLAEQRKEYEASAKQGGLAPTSAFGGELKKKHVQEADLLVEDAFEDRNPANMEIALNPRPEARLRWQRKMVIREIKHRGRMNKTIRIARTEREHTSRSHFFKTSMKKLAPLARQIAGKSIDEAILQMRFSNKKVAQDVRQHLIQARNEAIVIKGMGLGRAGSETTSELHSDPAETPPLPHQTPLKTYKKGEAADPTDIYVAQAWTNRGPYDKEPEYRARGRMNILRPPHTGLSLLLKEEKTRTREKAEKEARALKKRLGKSMWVQLPDRPVTTQRQHVLW